MTVAVRPQPMSDGYQFGGRSLATALRHCTRSRACSAICASAMMVNTTPRGHVWTEPAVQEESDVLRSVRVRRPAA